MTTREITFTNDQIKLLRQLLNDAWHDLDQARMRTRPDSPQEASCLADQLDIEKIQGLLRR